MAKIENSEEVRKAILMRNIPLVERDRLISSAPNVFDGRGVYWRRAHGGDPR